MERRFKGWDEATKHLTAFLHTGDLELNEGQCHSLRAIAKRIRNNGVIIADEVGMGKTRIAAAFARSVVEAGGRVAILVPPGLGFQWNDELKSMKVEAPPVLRSLPQYLNAWSGQAASSPWNLENVLVISHVVCNWRLSDGSGSHRWGLLPAIYAAWRRRNTGRYPRGYNARNVDELVRSAGEQIVDTIAKSPASSPARKLLDAIGEQVPWPAALNPAAYSRNEELRPWLERAVGLGLGEFDLVIIDEAHKSRAGASGLSRLLENVVVKSDLARRLAITATPVELGVEQWGQVLGRIDAHETAKSPAISAYAKAVRDVRAAPSSATHRTTYQKASKNFSDLLRPFLLRRDKRGDPWVRKFNEHSGRPSHEYRRQTEISIDTMTLPVSWKQAVCAAEALSFVTRGAEDPVAKRLRLTLGNGHGIAAFLDNARAEAGDYDGGQAVNHDSPKDDSESSDSYRLARAQWWREVMVNAFEGRNSNLFDHPAILAAVTEIERVCSLDEKVLVFGKFTRPMRALVELLNAREMLRCLDHAGPWPQTKVHESERPAVEAAHRQLGRSRPLDFDEINSALELQYKAREQERRSLRDGLLKSIERGLKGAYMGMRARALFEAFKEDVANANEDSRSLAVVARALQDYLAPNSNPKPEDFVAGFAAVIDAASDQDEGDTDGDGNLDPHEAAVVWSEILKRLDEEFGRVEGGFARFMFGETRPATRRLLQLAFNRRHSYPKVLVAQSLVGREGLNLHRACRTVVLLHPEWNPGVVEQQVGRVDRIGSLWEGLLKNAIERGCDDPGECPQIEFRPVVFKGTYDEKNWNVLQERWDELRAQLHGIVIPPRLAGRYAGFDTLINEINAAAPNFSPEDDK
jgi:hypothetical protein